MKRRISICIVICTAALSTAFLLNGNRSAEPEETQMTELVEETKDEPTVVANTDNTAVFLYVIRDCEGMLVVYQSETSEIYMETGIRTAELPPEIRERLSAGIGFEDEESLFDFLESYSS